MPASNSNTLMHYVPYIVLALGLVWSWVSFFKLHTKADRKISDIVWNVVASVLIANALAGYIWFDSLRTASALYACFSVGMTIAFGLAFIVLLVLDVANYVLARKR